MTEHYKGNANTMKTITKSFIGRTAVLALLPTLALGLFMAPAMASADGNRGGSRDGITTEVEVTNVNNAAVVNAFSVRSDTGGNTANGGDGGESGDTGDSGDGAGSGGSGGDGGDGGNASARSGDLSYADSGAGARGGTGGDGGNTGNTGASGDTGDGGDGGRITTGNAISTLTVQNDVNSNRTTVEISNDCDECAPYNEYYMAADAYYQANHRSASSYEDLGGSGSEAYDGRGETSSSSYVDRGESGASSESGSMTGESSWVMYSKEYVPVRTEVEVENVNNGFVLNMGSVESETGDNAADGGDGGESGTTGDSGSGAGSGGSGGIGGDGGNARALTSDDDGGRDLCFDRRSGCGDDDDGDGMAIAIADDGGAGATGGEGGNTGNTGASGDTGTGGSGGVVVTGIADSLAGVVNVTNRNVTRIVR